MSNGGIDKLIEQLTELMSDDVADAINWAIGDSPIEKLFFVALSSYVRFGGWFDSTQLITSEEQLQSVKSHGDQRCLLIQPQVQIEDWRVDFVIHGWADYRTESPGWVSLIVECDGHDFHERTKAQAKRDRARDRGAQMGGRCVFRFTGSELWRDPLGCAREVSEWFERQRG